jgi:hypothetical protein
MLPRYLTCPWCHSPMVLMEIECEDGHIHRGQEQLRDYGYACDCCGATSTNVYCVCTHEWAERRLAEICGIEVQHVSI